MGRKSREKWLRRFGQQEEAVEPSRPSRVTSIRQEFSGPIPPPALLQQYENILPGAAERILQMAERQSTHRMGLENKVIDSDIKKSELGQRLGFIVAMAGLTAAVILAVTGHEITAGLIAGIDLVSLAGVFVFGRWRKEKERETSRNA